MRAFPRDYWPRLAFYGVLLFLAWVLGGLFAAATIECLVCIGIGATLRIEWRYKTEAFALHRKLSPRGTSTMALAQTPLLHLEHHRRVARAQDRRGAQAT